jgi:hypothetical protein
VILLPRRAIATEATTISRRWMIWKLMEGTWRSSNPGRFRIRERRALVDERESTIKITSTKIQIRSSTTVRNVLDFYPSNSDTEYLVPSFLASHQVSSLALEKL